MGCRPSCSLWKTAEKYETNCDHSVLDEKKICHILAISYRFLNWEGPNWTIGEEMSKAGCGRNTTHSWKPALKRRNVWDRNSLFLGDQV